MNHFHSVTTQMQAAIYYHCIIFLIPYNGNCMCNGSDFIWPFLGPCMGLSPNPKMAFIFSISCILALIFPILMKYFPKCKGKGSFLKSQIKSLNGLICSKLTENAVIMRYSFSLSDCHFSLIFLEGEVTSPYCQGPA